MKKIGKQSIPNFINVVRMLNINGNAATLLAHIPKKRLKHLFEDGTVWFLSSVKTWLGVFNLSSYLGMLVLNVTANKL